ncbi:MULTISPECIES: transposase family protein [unclassified Streptomyces]|uniref:transposase family protein n=1 Tax=unclassified Streptomyces TaxID=2593676 RepID=UPI000DAC4C2D|nr:MULTISPECIES: transposase family protein [unclassified Streptomyces]PZT72595.1 IS5/IS1182 family transposase [Streptomyces sp. AC1-42T]PZT73811.1 IS5/IS1182 family transposase [Streptomyces sp. AC1-42T]PZT81087.1 IS5/IS1182 family transposase [Streptomyces sp. AC1-42W]PZT83193.1 IS5/IS1182 family transposase [Streptomyces sp. AC1-42W]
MLVYPSGIDLSSRVLRHLSGVLAGHRRRIGSRWRRLSCGRQALLVLAHLRCGDTYARLAAGFRIGIATAYRYIREAVDLLAALAPTLEQAMTTVRKKAYVILDGTVLPIDRIAANRPYYSGKKKHHGMNVQVLADPAGRLIWVSDALPGAVHDLTAARTHGIPAALAADATKCWADKAYQSAGPAVRVPFRGKNLRGWRRRHNRDHAKIRSLGERAMATLKCWRLLRKLRCSTTRITAVVRAVVALELAT